MEVIQTAAILMEPFGIKVEVQESKSPPTPKGGQSCSGSPLDCAQLSVGSSLLQRSECWAWIHFPTLANGGNYEKTRQTNKKASQLQLAGANHMALSNPYKRCQEQDRLPFWPVQDNSIFIIPVIN